MSGMWQFRFGNRLTVEAWPEPRAFSVGMAVAWSSYSANIAFHLGLLHFGATWFRGAFLTRFKDTRHAR